MKKRVGLIGLGNIGSYFTKQLLNAGYPLTVLDLDEEKVKSAVKQGAKAASTPAELTDESDLILLSLPGSPAVEKVMDGQDGILSRIRKGQLVIDTGTSRPATDIKYEKLCAEKGAGFLDAPITWRQAGLTVMAGGKAEHFEQGKEVLECISYKLKHVGEIGQGQVLKLINQMILANQLAVFSEAFEMCKLHGVDVTLLKSFLDFPIPDKLYTGEYEGGGHLALHYKDLLYLIEIAHDSGANIPISSLVHEIFKASKIYGNPNWYQVGIATYWQRLNNRLNEEKMN